MRSRFGLIGVLCILLGGCSGAVDPPGAPPPAVPPETVPVGWTPLGGPPGAVLALAAVGNPPTLFAGTRQGVYQSTDGGAQWQATGWPAGAPGRITALLAISETSGAAPVVLAGTGRGLWRRAGGGGWQIALLGPGAAPGITSLAAGDGGTAGGPPIYAGTSRGLYTSTDGGVTWARVGTVPGIVRAVVNLPDHGGLLAATDAGLVQPDAARPAPARLLVQSGAAPPQVFALAHDGRLPVVATDQGVYRWAGSAWEQLTLSPARALALLPGGDWLAGGDRSVISARSAADDELAPAQPGGAPRAMGLPAAPVYALLAVGRQIFAGSEGGVYVSGDGRHWANRSVGLPPAPDLTGLVTVAGDNPVTLYVGTPTGVFRSDDEGARWRLAAAGLPPGGVRSLTRTTGGAPALVAATAMGVYQSGDGGATWQPTPAQPANRDIQHLWVDPTNREHLYAALGGAGGLAYSWNGGQAWIAPAVRLPPGTLITALLVDPADALRPTAGVRYLRRGGPLADAGAPGVWQPQVTTEGEMAWQAVGAGLRLARGNGDAVTTLARLPGDSRLLATTGSGVWAATPGDSGLRWAPPANWPALPGGPAGGAGAVATYPQRDTIVYAGGGGVVARRTSVTATWELLGRPPAGPGVAALAVLPLGSTDAAHVSAEVLAAVPGQGLWRYTDDGLPTPVAAPPRPPAPTDRVPPGDPAQADYFQETGHNLGGGFRDYWYANDGLFLFGFPITEEFPEFNAAEGITRTVQYFERARLEVHPNPKGAPGTIQAGLLGRELTAGQYFVPARFFAGDPSRIFFGATQHAIGGAFYTFWRKHGGLARFGYPISEEVRQDGATVQWFERARLVWHPEFAYQDIDKEVTPALLGVETLRQRGWLPP